MYSLFFKPCFYNDLRKNVKDKIIRKQIIAKSLELEYRAPIGKKLVGWNYWSLHINKYRIIYSIDKEKITFLRILQRKHNYGELNKI